MDTLQSFFTTINEQRDHTQMKFGHAMKSLALNRANVALTRCGGDRHHPILEDFFRRCRPMVTEHQLVRIGNANDGGYLLPDDLDGIQTCYSPGVSTMADFELALTRRGINCYLADYSVDSAPVTDPLISFEKKFLGGTNSSKYMTLSSWIDRTSKLQDNDLLLQMDIEGAEYNVLVDTSTEVLQRFRILVIEFHSMEALFTPMGFRLIDAVFTKVLGQFSVVHIHPNNCMVRQRYGRFEVPPLMEFTFLRKDRITCPSPAYKFPHALDATNVPENADFSLPPCWYAN